MQVTVKNLKGGTEHCVEVQPTDTGLMLKDRITDLTAVPQKFQKLIYCGKPVKDQTIINELKLTPSAKIHLMISENYKPISKPKEILEDNFYKNLELKLKLYLPESKIQSTIAHFKNNVQDMIDSMNFDDIERFAASNLNAF